MRNWRHFQQQQHHGGNAPSSHHQSSYQRPHQQLKDALNCAKVQKDVVAFIEGFRANQSSPSAPPNALTLDIVVHAICNHFHVNAFEELMGTNALQLPALRQLHTVNQRVWTFVTCYIQGRRINTLYECHQAFLQHEGLRSFHELKLGNSFLHTEAVQQLYMLPRVMFTVTTGDVLSCLRQFEDLLAQDVFRASTHVELPDFLHFLAQHYRQSSAQAMGVFIDPHGFGVYVGLLRRVANYEIKELKILEQQFQREVAEKMFRLTKEKFSDDNRKRALNELFQQVHERNETEKRSHTRRGDTKSSSQSLSLDVLKRVTDVDVYLDNVLRRKTAFSAKTPLQCCNPISSHTIAETDSKLRNQLTRFLASSQKSRHQGRLKVVTWVICSIMAKTYALLLSDDKLPTEDQDDLTKVVADSDKEECDCCCVGKDSCTCLCTCKCHVESSDEEDERDDENILKEETDTTLPSNSKTFPVSPTDPFATKYEKLNNNANVMLETVKTEVVSFLNAKLLSDQPHTVKNVLLMLSSLEKHLVSKFAAQTKDVSWAGQRSVLELLPKLIDDPEDDGDVGASTCLSRLIPSIPVSGVGAKAIETTNKKLAEEILPFVRECCATIASSSSLSSLSSVKQQDWITRRLSAELGRAHIQDSAFPTVVEILKILDQETTSDVASIIKYAGSLDLPYDSYGSCEDATGESKQVLIEQALEKLRSCPFLIDVALYMNWQERYAPVCGPLLSFIRVHEMILLDHAPSNNLLFVCCINGTILRVNEKSTPFDLELLLRRAEQEDACVAASHIALHLVSMVVTCRGQENFPQQLVQAHLRAYVAKVETQYIKQLVLRVLMETPVELADFIVSLLLGAIGHVAGSDFVFQVWEACRTDAERKALLYISSRSSLALWTNQTEKWGSVRTHLTDASNATDACIIANEYEMGAAEKKSALLIDAACSTLEDESSFKSTSAMEEQIFPCESSVLEGNEVSWTEKHTNSCHLFIKNLRKKQFGIGLEIQDDATTSVLLNQQQRLERALKRLSDELYSESTHFVLELLQNADDNKYDETVTPLGEFTLTTDKEIVFYNNEQGFSPANIQAICDVGASTKAATDSGAYIGKKGIGFKSVFKVSDNPQVHSNGFHICFKATSSTHGNGMGYILPHWLDDVHQWKQRRGTTFVLPLNESSVQRMDSIAQSLFAFESSVLLFLRRMQELRLCDLARQYSLHFLKKEKTLHRDSKLVQLYSQVKTIDSSVKVTQQLWLVVKKTLKVPQIFAQKHTTNIALAFPNLLEKDFNKQCDRPSPQQVFCYLPLRSYGFRFILQGDFEIPSSREAITIGSEWNEWLISKFPLLVRDAVQCYISTLPAKDIIDGIAHLLALLPHEKEVQAPFQSIVSEIMHQLRQVKWLPSATPSTQSKLYMPAELIDCSTLLVNDPSEDTIELLEVLSEDALVSTFSKRFLHFALSSGMSRSIKSQLRVEQLRASHLMPILSLSAEKNDIHWTVNVLALLAKLWRVDRHSSLLRQELRLIKCFPSQQHEHTHGKFKWISLADGHDSLFISGHQAGDEDLIRRPFYTFYSDLRILDNTFTNAVNKSFKLRAFLLDDVGLHVTEEHEVIRHHIEPKMAALRSLTEDENKDKVGARSVIEYGQFLASHLTRCRNCSMPAGAKANTVVATSSDRLVPVDRQNLFAILPSTSRKISQLVEWITSKLETCDKADNALAIVSDRYYCDHDTQTQSRDSDEQWQHFFTEICGVPMLFDVASLFLDARSQAGMKQLLIWIEAEEDKSVKRSISMLLAQYLDTQWKVSKDDKSAESPASTGDEDTGLDFWQHYRWLEGSDAQFYRPSDLWLTTNDNARLFSPSMVTFSPMVWHSDEFSTRVLGMKSTATVTDVLSVISAIAVDSAAMALVVIDQMIRIYSFLWEDSQRSDESKAEITSAFTRKPIIFVPAKGATKGREAYFTGTNNAVWTSALQKRELVVLKSLYPKSLSHFFTQVCGVQRKPSVSFLCKLLAEQQAHLTTKRGRKPSGIKAWKKKVLPLLDALSKKVKKRSLSKEEMKEIKMTLKSVPWLPVRSISGCNCDLEFCSSKDQPIQATTENERKLQKLAISLITEKVADSGNGVNEERHRMNEEGIRFVQADFFAEVAYLNALLNLAKVSTLSTHLKFHVNTWCNVLARWTKSCQHDRKTRRKKMMKFGRMLVQAWARTFASGDEPEKSKFLSTIQHLKLFPTIDKKRPWASAASMYINDQTELLREDLLKPGQAQQLIVLGLFPWSYFVKGLDEDDRSDATRVQMFLVEWCGMKSLKAHLQYEVSVLSTQHPASDAFHAKIHTAFALAQRFLFHCHRILYDQLPHDAIAKLASEIQCMLVDGHEGLQVVYRVGSSFSLRRGVNGLFRCFLDLSTSSLYIQSVVGDEEASALSVVLVELSRKLFGAHVAANAANFLHLSLLQPNALMREQWLRNTQLLPPLPPSEADKLWAQQEEEDACISGSSVKSNTHKRSLIDMEDGEIAGVKARSKNIHYEQKIQKIETICPPVTLSNEGTVVSYGMHKQRSPYAPFSRNKDANGATCYQQLPFASSNADMLSLSLSNAMTQEEREAIGRWGEEYVYDKLKRQHAESPVTVEWVNENKESGLPYDLMLVSGGKVVEYIEVKSTRTTEKGVFEISMNELDQAAIHGSTYCIYRVFNAGNSALCRVIRLKNPVSLVRQRKIQLALVMQ